MRSAERREVFVDDCREAIGFLEQGCCRSGGRVSGSMSHTAANAAVNAANALPVDPAAVHAAASELMESVAGATFAVDVDAALGAINGLAAVAEKIPCVGLIVVPMKEIVGMVREARYNKVRKQRKRKEKKRKKGRKRMGYFRAALAPLPITLFSFLSFIICSFLSLTTFS